MANGTVSGRLIAAAAVVVIIAGAVGASTSWSSHLRPKYLVVANSYPAEARMEHGRWYWIERPAKSASRLVRTGGSHLETLATADEILGFDVQSDSVVWTARQGARWLIGAIRGTRANHWDSDVPLGRPAVDGDRVFWSARHPGILASGSSNPILGPVQRIWMADGSGHARSLGTLPENTCGVVGASGDAVYASCERSLSGEQTVVYALSVGTGNVERIIGEKGPCSVHLGRQRELVWTAPSRDSSSKAVYSVRSLSPGKPPKVLADWLPRPGDVAFFGDRILYVGGPGVPAVYRIGSSNDLPEVIPQFPGYAAVSVGEGLVLLRTTEGKDGTFRLYTAPLSR